VLQHRAERPWGIPGDRIKPSGGILVGGCAIAGREAGGRAAHLLSREGVPDREKLHRVTAVGWKRSWRVSSNRNSAHRDKARPGIEEDRDRDVRGSVERRSWVRTKTPPRYVLDPLKRFGAS